MNQLRYASPLLLNWVSLAKPRLKQPMMLVTALCMAAIMPIMPTFVASAQSSTTLPSPSSSQSEPRSSMELSSESSSDSGDSGEDSELLESFAGNRAPDNKESSLQEEDDKTSVSTMHIRVNDSSTAKEQLSATSEGHGRDFSKHIIGEITKIADVPVKAPSSARKYFFPLEGPPLLPFLYGGREFGAPREQSRLHAGVDLLEYAGRPVFAVTGGKIVDYDFYDGTNAVVVDHGEFIVRYGGVREMYGNLRVGDGVKAGQKIALVGVSQSRGFSMLHFEMYSGKLGREPLTVLNSGSRYQRRADLVNPTRFLRSLEGSYPSSG